MKHLTKIIGLFSILLFLNGCAAIQSLTNLANCEYRMRSLTNATLAGVDVQRVNDLKSLSFTEIGKLTSAYLNKDLPLSFRLNIEAKNPNSQAAVLNKFDWILSIDDIEMTRSSHTEPVNVPPNSGTTTIPLHVSFDLFQTLEKESREALLNFAFNLADASNKPTRVDLKIKPTLYINDIPLTYPDYLKVGTEFGGS